MEMLPIFGTLHVFLEMIIMIAGNAATILNSACVSRNVPDLKVVSCQDSPKEDLEVP